MNDEDKDLEAALSDIKPQINLDDMEDVADGEAVICDLPQDCADAWAVIQADTERLRVLKNKISAMMRTHQAKQVLFWDSLKNANEAVDAAELDDFTIGVRKQDGRPVVVKFKSPQNDGPSIGGILGQILGGGGPT